MFSDTDHWLFQCEQCLISKGDYTEPKRQQGRLVAHQPLELLSMDFTKADVDKGGKENIFVLTDAFSKYSQAFVTTNQKSLTVANIFVEKWFSILEFLSGSTVVKIDPLTMRSFLIFAKCTASENSTTMPYNPRGNCQCEQFNHTLFGLMKTLNS